MAMKVKNSAPSVKPASAAANPASRVSKPAVAAEAAASAVQVRRIHNAAPPAANGLSPELDWVFDMMLADIDLRLANIGRDTDERLARYNLA